MIKTSIFKPFAHYVLVAAAFGFVAPQAQAGVVRDHGALKVSGNKIVDESGVPTQIAGMSMYWPNWEGAQYYTKEAVSTLVNDWGSSVVRAPMPVFTTNSNPNVVYDAKYIDDVKRVVQAAIDADIYVIVDWHLEGDHPQLELAKKFFGEMARTYGKYPNVIWEIWNEPIFWKDHYGWTRDDNGWTDIQAYTKEILGVIRPYSSNLVLVGSGYWSSNISDPMNNPIDEPNIAYSLHFYACFWDGNGNPQGRDWAAQVAKKIPLFMTEWGTTKNDGTGKICFDESDKWLAMAKENGIGWAAWSFSHQGGLSAALNKGQGLSSLTENGNYLKRKIQEVGAELARRKKVDTTQLPGRILASTYSTSSAELKLEPTTDQGGGMDLGYSTNGSWAEFVAKVPAAGKYRIKARVASANSGTLAFRWKGQALGSLAVGTTGGWQSWRTDSLDVQIPSTGAGAMRVDWSGAAQGLVNLNWLDVQNLTSAVEHPHRLSGCEVRGRGNRLVLTYPPQARRAKVMHLDGGEIADVELRGNGRMELTIPQTGLMLVAFEGADGSTVLRAVGAF